MRERGGREGGKEREGREGRRGREREGGCKKVESVGNKKENQILSKNEHNYKLLIIFEFWTVCAPPQSVAMVSSQRAAPLD